jgi:hypothetical protein
MKRFYLSPETREKVEEYAEKVSLSIDEAVYELASIGLKMVEVKAPLF